MLKGLEKLIEAGPITCRAVAGRYSMSTRRDGERVIFDLTLLLKNVTAVVIDIAPQSVIEPEPQSMTGTCKRELIADHVWIRVFDGSMLFLGAISGDRVEFEAELYSYTKANGEKGCSFRKCTRLRIIVRDLDGYTSDPRRQHLQEEQMIQLAQIVGEEPVEAWGPYANQWTCRKILRMWTRAARKVLLSKGSIRPQVGRKHKSPTTVK